MTADQSRTQQRLYTAVAVLACVGVLLSSISLYHHLSNSKGSFCDLSQSFNCDLVNRSQYSTLHGMPVAMIGIIGYLLVFVLGTLYRQKAETPIMLLLTTIAGNGFALYLTYLEGYVIHAWCILCLASLAVISSLSVTSIFVFNAARRA